MLVNNIFNSIDGEVNYFGQGRFATFIRLQGCSGICTYCDTPQAQDKTKAPFKMTPTEVFKKVESMGNNKITITGGEPLEQKNNLIKLLEMFNRAEKYDISVETNGSKSLFQISSLASWVVDYKLPSSGMMEKMNELAFAYLTSHDIVKFVVKDLYDFNHAKKFMRRMFNNYTGDKNEFPTFAFGAIFKKLKPFILFDWIQESGLTKYYKIALNIQLHKILNLP